MRYLEIWAACFIFVASSTAQTILSNNTAVSGTVAGKGITVFEFGVQANEDIHVVVTLLSGSCSSAPLRDGSSLPLSTFSRASTRVAIGTTRVAITSCTVGSAPKWYFELENECSAVAVQYQITVFSVSRLCTVPFSSGNGTDAYMLRTSDRWAFYSVPLTSPTEVRVLLKPVSESSTCQGYSVYTRLDQAPTIDFYDDLTDANYGWGDLIRWRSSCQPIGTLFVGVRIDCPSMSNTAFVIQVQSFPRPCAVPLLAPFPNSQYWSVRPEKFTYFVLPLASLSMNKNMSVVVTARALSTSRTSYAKLWTRAGDRPSVDFYDFATQSSSTPQVAYSACDVRDINGDLFFGVSNPTTSYYYGLDFEFITKTVKIACNEVMLPFVAYTGEVGSYWFQRYSVPLGEAPRFIITLASSVGSPTSYVTFVGRWNDEPDSSNNDVKVSGQSPATIRYDGCDPSVVPKTGIFFGGVQSGSSGVDLRYTIAVNFFYRPCVLEVPSEGLFVTESAVNTLFSFYYSWAATTGQNLRVQVNSASTFEVRYAFNDRSTNSGSQLYTLPGYITAAQSGTYYIRIRSLSSSISPLNPTNISVSLYDETTAPPMAAPVRPPSPATPPTAPPVAAPVRPPSPAAPPAPSASATETPASTKIGSARRAEVSWSTLLILAVIAVVECLAPLFV